VNEYTAVPFCSIEPVNVSVASVAVAVGVVTVEALELDPHPADHNIATIESTRPHGRTKRGANFIDLLSFCDPIFLTARGARPSTACPGDHVEPCDA
jgi:hypothetical protein